MSKIKLEITEDGTHTLYSPETGEHYHSIHGARQESDHVFIGAGLEYISRKTSEIRVLEIGFGTGLNCLLTLAKSAETTIHVEYLGLEPFPIDNEIAEKLNYCSMPDLSGFSEVFKHMHTIASGERASLINGFAFLRSKEGIGEVNLATGYFNLVYFDAFSPEAAPELWEPAVFKKIRLSMQLGGVLVTYCAKGAVRRAMQQNGFATERLPGPPGKREMLRATAV